MWAWDDPQSFATGILDDITYDWIPLLQRTVETGGEPIVADEILIERAYALAHQHTDIPVCSTGTAGFAGLMQAPPSRTGASAAEALSAGEAGASTATSFPETSFPERVVLLFTGIDRT